MLKRGATEVSPLSKITMQFFSVVATYPCWYLRNMKDYTAGSGEFFLSTIYLILFFHDLGFDHKDMKAALQLSLIHIYHSKDTVYNMNFVHEVDQEVPKEKLHHLYETSPCLSLIHIYTIN